MVLSDINELWGIPLVYLKEYSKKYRLYNWIIYLIDALLIIGVTAFMYFKKMSFEAYGFFVVIIAVFAYLGMSKFLNMENWLVFKFYKHHQWCRVEERKYNIDSDSLYSILYCANYKRLKPNRTEQEYREVMCGACCENSKYSSKLMDFMKKYQSPSGAVTCYILIRKNKQFFIGFKEER